MLKTLLNLPRRVVSAMRYSLGGLKVALKKEESFKLEALALALLVGILALVDWPSWKKFCLIGVFLIIPLTELVNSALEDICDLVTKEIHPKVKAAKDKGSAAVLLAILIGLVALAALIAYPDQP
jgi:diacylglycerol kinase (ATP)